MKLHLGLIGILFSVLLLSSGCDLSTFFIASRVIDGTHANVTAVMLPNTISGPITPTPLPTIIGCTPRTDLPVYIVAFGDTLSTIAFRAGTDVQSLMQNNCLSDPNLIAVGQTLYVPIAIHTLVPAINLATPTNTVVSGSILTDRPGRFDTPTPVSGSILTDRPGRFDTPTPDPIVNSFTVNPISANGGDTVTIAWDVSGVQSVTVRSILADGNIGATYINLPLSGTLSDPIPSSARDWITYQLIPDPLPPRGAYPEITVQLQSSVQRPEIVAYSPDSYSANTGETITLFWDVRGANGVSIRVVLPSGQYGTWYHDLPAQGNLSYSFPEGIIGQYAFQLVPMPEDAANPIGQVNVEVAVPQ